MTDREPAEGRNRRARPAGRHSGCDFPEPVRVVAVLGDIGGQVGVFRRVLADLGGDPPTGRLPTDLAVVQVGDVVRVPGDRLDNAGCVDLAERCRVANPGRWVQLVGNHDLAALGGPRRPSWPPHSGDAAPAVLRRWWNRRQVLLAFAMTTSELGAVLITHAGLTRGRWCLLGSPTDPYAAATLINADIGRPISEVIHGGRLTGADSGPGAERADVTWAEVNGELYEPWLAAGDAPFTLIHGHASPWNWSTGAWWPDASAAVRAATRVDPSVRRTHTRLGSAGAIGVDWMLGDDPVDTTWPILTLTRQPSGFQEC